MLKNIYVIITIKAKLKPAKSNFKTFLSITYFINRLKTGNRKRKSIFKNK